MILHCNFEELQALAAGAELVLSEESGRDDTIVVAPTAVSAQIELLLPRLTGDLSIDTLAEQQGIRNAVAAICETLRMRLESRVLEYHPAHEEAVAHYFDFAHVRTVLHRLDVMGAEMRALVELLTGGPPTPEGATTVTFPD